MKQIIKFELEIFDVRTRKSFKIIDDPSLVRSINIVKNTALDNRAVVTFQKPKSYRLLAELEEKLQLYNYVKLKVTTKTYGETNHVFINENEQTDTNEFYFSGFLSDVRKGFNFRSPDANLSIVISDYGSLLKTTFYSKNLVFLDILNQAIPELRLLNFNEIFNDHNSKLISNFYTPNQIGFLLFSFFFYKFFNQIAFGSDGSPKTDQDGNSIYKDFKLYMPFDIDLGGKKSMFDQQSTSLLIYKQIQTVAYDLFKYLYPEPFFEFNTYENEKSCILIVRPTPFMSFERKTKRSVQFQAERLQGNQESQILDFSAETEGAVFSADDYSIIEKDDFGFENIQRNRESVIDAIVSKNQKINDILNKSLSLKQSIRLQQLIPSVAESNDIVSKLYNEINFNITFLDSLQMNRSANSVVNLIWTTPVTDTAVLQTSGRAIVFAGMQDTLNNTSLIKSSTFGEYLFKQFEPGTEFNPVFLWNYRQQFPDQFVSGDINYFGIREFEAKWNYLTSYDDVVYQFLSHLDRNKLIELRQSFEGKPFQKILTDAIIASSQPIDEKAKRIPRVIKKEVNPLVKDILGPNVKWITGDPLWGTSFDTAKKPLRNTTKATEVKKSKIAEIKKGFPAEFVSKMKEQYGIDITELKNNSAIIDVVKKLQELNKDTMGKFVNRLNYVLSRAYRENEHLYEIVASTVLNTTILPGMILKTTHKNPIYNSPKFKGYVTAVSHTFDFNAASFMTQFNVSRAAAEDSGVQINE